MIRAIKRRKGQEMQEHAWNSASLLQSLALAWKNWGPNGFLRTGWYLIRSPGILACSSRPLSSHSLHFPLGISNKKASPVSAPVILETLEDSKGRISLESTDLRSPLSDTNDCREVHGFRMKWAGPDSLNEAGAIWISRDLESPARSEQQGASLHSREAAAPEERCFFKYLLSWVLLLLLPTKVGSGGMCSLQEQFGEGAMQRGEGKQKQWKALLLKELFLSYKKSRGTKACSLSPSLERACWESQDPGLCISFPSCICWHGVLLHCPESQVHTQGNFAPMYKLLYLHNLQGVAQT